MRNFRLLTADEIECRIKTQDSNSGVTLLLYKTARTDAKLLDETFGMHGWANEYKVINDNLYCGIGVHYRELDEWVWKWNCGTESNTEKEKGEASDAFKRAGFTWGIGTELYSSPRIWINASDLEFDSKGKCSTRFSVAEIGYDANEDINHLVIAGWDRKNGKRTVFTTGKAQTSPPQKKNAAKPKEEPKTEPPIFNCTICGREIKGGKRKDGTVITPQDMVNLSKERLGRAYCSSCFAEALKNEH